MDKLFYIFFLIIFRLIYISKSVCNFKVVLKYYFSYSIQFFFWSLSKCFFSLDHSLSLQKNWDDFLEFSMPPIHPKKNEKTNFGFSKLIRENGWVS